MLLKQSTARNVAVFMVDSTDKTTGKTGLTLTISASKDGAAFATITPVVTELTFGWYSLALTATHTNTLGNFLLHVTGTAADPVDKLLLVVPDLPGASVSSVTGAVGSVTGAVGSVTGNVGGNVVGSVASVVGAVGSVTGLTASNLDATISSRSTYAGGAVASVTGAVGSVTGNVGGNVVGSVASVTSGVTVTTNNDKTGYGLSSAAVQAIWDALTSALTTVGSIGKLFVDNINATISSRLASASYTTPPTESAIADQVWDEVLSGHLTAGTTGAALNGAGAAGDPWTTLLPGAYGAGTAGKIVGDNINATISSRSTYAGGAVASVTGAVGSVTGNVGGNVTGSVGSVVGAVGSVTGAVGSVTGLTASNLDATISSRLSSAGYTAPDNTSVTAIKAKTDSLTFTTANRVDSTAITVSDKTGYSLASSQLFIKKNVALSNFMFVMTDSTSHAPTAGLTVTATRSIDGGAFAACANSASGISSGVYKIDLAAADLNGTLITLRFTATGADDRLVTIVTQA